MRFLVLFCRLLFTVAAYAVPFIAFWHLGTAGIIVAAVIGTALSLWVFAIHDWKTVLSSVIVAVGSGFGAFLGYLVGPFCEHILGFPPTIDQNTVMGSGRDLVASVIGAILGGLLFSWANSRMSLRWYPCCVGEQAMIRHAVYGLACGLLIGWIVGMLWWTTLVITFGLKPEVVAVIVDSSGLHETQVTVLQRVALIPVRALPWAVVVGIVGAATAWKNGTQEERPKTNRRVVMGLAYGLLVGWVVGTLSMTSLAIAFGPGGDSLCQVNGQVVVEHFHPVVEMVARVGWLVVPWAVFGSVVGAIIGWIGGWLEIVTSCVGMTGGICLVLSDSLAKPFADTWLVLKMPIYAFVGTSIGLAAGCVVRLAIWLIRLVSAGGTR